MLALGSGTYPHTTLTRLSHTPGAWVGPPSSSLSLRLAGPANRWLRIVCCRRSLLASYRTDQRGVCTAGFEWLLACMCRLT